ncbi:GNAT family N-acetyltransferase [Acetobacter fabarum]|uniref:GNAT family N-acetyltransferase n=1 Tax=Acetobacter fabarum TaxID=483199 RepID=UPI00312BB245
MPCTIRLACLADAPYLPALEQDAAQAFAAIPELVWLTGGDGLDLATHTASIAARTCWVAASATGQLLGFVTAHLYGLDLHIQEMSVTQAAQGQGLGRRLLHAVCTAAQQRGLQRVTLTTFVNVPWNAPFYASAGFCHVSHAALDVRLASILEHENATGLAAIPRCAMQYVVAASVQCVSK